jgi:hypothetical protein
MLGRRRMPAKEWKRWSTMEGRVAGHCRRRAVRVRVATGGSDVVRTRLREERSWVRKGISGGRVWWRWWELFYRQLVARGFELRIATAQSDMGIGGAAATTTTASADCASRRALMSAICSRTSASASCVGAT